MPWKTGDWWCVVAARSYLERVLERADAASDERVPAAFRAAEYEDEIY